MEQLRMFCCGHRGSCTTAGCLQGYLGELHRPSQLQLPCPVPSCWQTGSSADPALWGRFHLWLWLCHPLQFCSFPQPGSLNFPAFLRASQYPFEKFLSCLRQQGLGSVLRNVSDSSPHLSLILSNCSYPCPTLTETSLLPYHFLLYA